MMARAILLITEPGVSGWLVHKSHYKLRCIILSGIELGAGIACAFYLRPSNGLLLQSQLGVSAGVCGAPSILLASV
jgi:hypothetical protein